MLYPTPMSCFQDGVKRGGSVAIKTKPVVVRFSGDEAAGLEDLALELGVTKSALLRRLAREAVREGPSYFPDNHKALKEMLRAFGAYQRNLSQVTARLSSGGDLDEDKLGASLIDVQRQLGDLKAWAMAEIKAVSNKSLALHRLEGEAE